MTFSLQDTARYTAGGMTDACGTYRHSGLRYKWAVLSVLNNDKPLDTVGNLPQYLVCFDAITAAVREVRRRVRTWRPFRSLQCNSSCARRSARLLTLSSLAEAALAFRLAQKEKAR